jgi:hypothetical protein
MEDQGIYLVKLSRVRLGQDDLDQIIQIPDGATNVKVSITYDVK